MRTWHRRLGIASAILVVWLALTGILLGHTDDLRLDERHLGSGWLLDWYGVRAPEIGEGYRVADAWVLQAGERIYFNDRPLEREYGPLLAAGTLGDEIVVAAGEQLVILTNSGVLVEAFAAPGAGGEISRARWSAASVAPQGLRERVAEDYRQRILSLERVVLDLHSGRVLGVAGVILMDLAALAFLGLAGTGLWLWFPRRNGFTVSKNDKEN